MLKFNNSTLNRDRPISRQKSPFLRKKPVFDDLECSLLSRIVLSGKCLKSVIVLNVPPRFEEGHVIGYGKDLNAEEYSWFVIVENSVVLRGVPTSNQLRSVD